MQVLVLCFVAALCLQLPSEGAAECCRASGIPRDRKIPGLVCNDCTTATPYCGYQGCNVFGCNCGGGCRSGSCGGRSGRSVDAVRSSDAHDVIRAADRDGDGVLSFSEARAHLAGHGGHLDKRSLEVTDVERLLQAMDTDKDSFLTAREIDSDA